MAGARRRTAAVFNPISRELLRQDGSAAKVLCSRKLRQLGRQKGGFPEMSPIWLMNPSEPNNPPRHVRAPVAVTGTAASHEIDL